MFTNLAHRVLIINGKAPDAGVGGVSDADFSHFTNRFLTPGVIGDADYEVEAQTSPDMTVKVNAGKAYVANPAGTMLYPTELPTAANVTITANVSGNDRIDAIVIKIDTTAIPDEYAENVISLVAVPGTPAGSPVAPTDGAIQTVVGAGNAWLRLANVTVENATASITSGDVSDAREQITFTLGGGSGADGWNEETETLTYASANTFTVAGNQTAKYGKGTRIKLTQTTLKYFVVISALHAAGTTTVTVTAGTDYSLANAAITDPFYSYQASPQGYPGLFTFTPTFAGFSVVPTVTAKFAITGILCTVYIHATVAGTSNANSFTFTIPVAASITSAGVGLGSGADNGSTLTSPCRIDVVGTATATLYKDFGGTIWTTSGSKYADVSMTYPF